MSGRQAPPFFAACERYQFLPEPLPGFTPLPSVRVVSNMSGTWIEERRYMNVEGQVFIAEVHASGLTVSRVQGCHATRLT
jgi:hypothetical protein